MCQGPSCKGHCDVHINLMWMLQLRTPVSKTTIVLYCSECDHCNPGSKFSVNKANIIPFSGAKDGKWLWHCACKLHDEAESRVLSQEPEIESVVPDSNWWKVHNPQSDWPRNIRYRQRHQRSATGNRWIGTGRKRRKSRFGLWTKLWTYVTRNENWRGETPRWWSKEQYQHCTTRSGRRWDQPKRIG